MEVKKIPDSVWKFLWSYYSKQKVLFFGVIISIAIGEFLVRYSLYYAAEIVKVLVSAESKSMVLRQGLFCAIIASLLLLIRSLVQNLMIFMEAKFMPVLVANVAKDLFSYAHRHSTAFFAEEMAGNISSKTKTIIDSLYPMYYNIIWGFSNPAIALMITFGFMFKINIELSFILLALNILAIYLMFLLGKQMAPYSEKRSKTMSEANGILVDSITNASLVKNFSNYKYEKRHYFKSMKIAAYAERKATQVFAKTHVAQNILRALIQAVFYALPVWYWYKDEITVADFVLIQSLIAVLSNIYSMFTGNFMNFYKTYGNISDGLKLLSKPSEVNDIKNAHILNITAAEIVFKDVFYHYKDSNPLFEDFNMVIKNKEKLGLVGRSGSGKSTLIKLLSRYYDLQSGKISIDGIDISKITQESLRAHISMIPQDPSLFNRTIMENIRYGKTGASDEEVFEAAKKAYIHDFIMTLPNGYNSKVGERGVMLSGGERQRIAIARAILKDAPILILDEATSALDSESEKYIQESLKELMKNKTVIAIAHRLSTLKEMSRIVVMEEGKIIEEGTHLALLRKKGAYYSFYAMQSSGFIEE